MAMFVLVHGAWQSAGTWDLLRPVLKARGHDVATPALTGLGLGNRNLSPEVSLASHIDGVSARLADFEKPVALVGHSYAGMVISGAAERHRAKVQRLIYIDAFVPEDGQCALDLLPPDIRTRFRKIASDVGGGWRLPGGDGQLDLWGLRPGPAREFVRSHLCDFSLKCFEEPIRLPDNRRAHLPTSYIACVANDYPAKPIFAPFADKARNLGWRVAEVDSGHDCHVEKPQEVAELLISALA